MTTSQSLAFLTPGSYPDHDPCLGPPSGSEGAS